MTMTREDKETHQIELQSARYYGGTLRRSAKTGQKFTAAEYKDKVMGRHGSRGMAMTKKMLKMGFKENERGGFKKIERKG
jgi:hypothetical protein